MLDVFLDALIDTLKLLPFLFAVYILIELLEHRTALGHPPKALNGRAAPLVGGAMGLVPLCGFSVMAAKLYEKKYLTLGTLFAVFLSTNDEALLVLLGSPLPWGNKFLTIALLLLFKFCFGVGAGYLLDALTKRRISPLKPFPASHEEFHVCEHKHVKERESEHDGHDSDHDEHDGHEHAHRHEHDGHEHAHGEEFHACEHKHKEAWNLYVLSPLWHSLKISFFVFLVNFAFGSLFFVSGEENVVAFLEAGLWVQPVIASLVGLIPNCASSVVLAETYAVGGIAFGSLLAGLMTNAGLGVLVLFKNVSAWKRNLFVVLLLFFVGVAAGYLVNVAAFFAGWM